MDTIMYKSPERHKDGKLCPVEEALNLIGGKWKGLIILRLLEQTWRFNALKRNISGCTQRMLTNQLRQLEADGIVKRTAYPEVPPRVEYRLTSVGRDLAPTIQALSEWGQKHIAGTDQDFVVSEPVNE